MKRERSIGGKLRAGKEDIAAAEKSAYNLFRNGFSYKEIGDFLAVSTPRAWSLVNKPKYFCQPERKKA